MYTTSTGWAGYPDEQVKELVQGAMAEGFTAFKMKVGMGIEVNLAILLLFSSRSLSRLFTVLLLSSHHSDVKFLGQDDSRRASLMRSLIGWDSQLMMDANSVWGVNEAIEEMTALAEFRPYWIEEPTSPDDILGHAAIQRVSQTAVVSLCFSAPLCTG